MSPIPFKPTPRFPPEPPPPLDGDDAVHLWSINLARLVEEYGLPTLQQLLSPADRARATRLLLDAPRRQFIAARAALRLLLGAYLSTPPASLSFALGSHGKPSLARGELQFNSSHTGEECLIALSRANPVGVDIELSRPVPEARRLAVRYFSPREAQALAEGWSSSPPKGHPVPRDEAFLHLWTRKEAFVKATGLGFAASRPRQFSVSAEADPPPGEGLLECAPPPPSSSPGEAAPPYPPPAEPWSILSLAPREGCLGALAIPHASPRPTAWRW